MPAIIRIAENLPAPPGRNAETYAIVTRIVAAVSAAIAERFTFAPAKGNAGPAVWCDSPRDARGAITVAASILSS